MVCQRRHHSGTVKFINLVGLEGELVQRWLVADDWFQPTLVLPRQKRVHLFEEDLQESRLETDTYTYSAEKIDGILHDLYYVRDKP